MKAVQKFSDDYLQRCSEMSANDIAKFLEDFRRLHGGRKSPSRLISLKVPEDMLETFKAKARLSGTPYQTMIKVLMGEWVRNG